MQARNDTALPLPPPSRSREHSPVSHEGETLQGSDEPYHHLAHPQPIQPQSKSTIVIAAEQDPCDVANWPSEPRDLQKGLRMKLVFAVMDLVLTATPIYFIGTGFPDRCYLV